MLVKLSRLFSVIFFIFSIFYLNKENYDISFHNIEKHISSGLINSNDYGETLIFSAKSNQKESQINEEEELDVWLKTEFDISTVDDLLDNIEHPKLQEYIRSLPFDAQKVLHTAALKQSVSKRVDDFELTGVPEHDVGRLFDDIDMLSSRGVMMSGEAERLKKYLQARIQGS